MRINAKNNLSYNFSSPLSRALKLFAVSFLFVFSLFNFSCCKNNDQDPDPVIIPEFKFTGLCYGPYRINEDPGFGVNPTISELREDIGFIKDLTLSIRTYGVTGDLDSIPFLCQQNNIDCYPGAWITKSECENEKQINSLIAIANQNLSHVKGLIVGNEVLLRKDLTTQQLLDYIYEVKASTNLPVATAETYSEWISNPDLANAVDILFVHIYPYWNGISIDNAMDYILESWNEVKSAYPNKIMVIGETGWPSEGQIIDNAIPGEENQRKYFSDFLSLVKENDIQYFYFEIFDEEWKNKFEGETGSHWGMYYSDGSIKEHLIDLIPTQGHNGINRPPRMVYPTIETLPVYIYYDGCSPENKFYASGWIGELAYLAENDSTNFNLLDYIDESCTDDPFSGASCIRISYTPSADGNWAGIYWQFPVNNWGIYPGYDFSNSISETDTVVLSFWAKGKTDNVKANFRAGGIANIYLDYRDSFGPAETDFVTLTTEWKKYSIDLTGRDLSMVIGGFCWVSDAERYPLCTTIYLDDIIIESF
jgi:exo-beta-1,3-glucanase (GH17 family)